MVDILASIKIDNHKLEDLEKNWGLGDNKGMNRDELLEMAKNLLDENLKLTKINNVLWEYIKEEDLIEINKILEEE